VNILSHKSIKNTI